MADQILVGTRKGLFTLRREDGAWVLDDEVAFLGDPVPMLHHDPRDGATYAALDHGHFGTKLHRRDAGGGWTEVGVPEYPEKPEGEDDLGSQDNAPIPWTLKLIWALEGAGPDQPGALWCGTLPGGLFRSDDRGDTWQLVEPLWYQDARRGWFGGGADWPGIHSVCVDPRDSQRVVVAISCGGVWLTQDGGASWTSAAKGMRAEYVPPEQQFDENIQDPHRVVQCPSSPDVYWAQHHNGIFRSSDGCKSWEEITSAVPNPFGFAVAVHPSDPDTAWFVPAVKDEARYPHAGQVVVSRTRDGGTSYELLRQGLPQHHAYDLVYRHALDVDAAGSTLAFGSTTGSLWVSQDGGEAWTTVSEHLPPVYVVQVVG